MNTKTEVQSPVPTETLNDIIIDSIQDIKGKKIVKLDLRDLDDAPADYFIICEGDSNTQVRAIGDNIYGRAKKEGFTLPLHHEGQQHSMWVCLDYFTTVVHIFYKETRAFYELEELWSDATLTEYESL